jgi:uncharacterized protein YndB with AHSA1/START domain
MTDHLTIERQLDAPREQVWAMWVDPDQFATWYGPTGATIPVATFDLRVGGRRLVCMEMPGVDGPTRMWFAGEFLEIVPHERLVYTEFMSDERGAPRTDMAPDGHPATTEVHVQLDADGDRTRMTMTHVGIPTDSPGAMGWTMAFDKLDTRIQATSPRRGAGYSFKSSLE